MDLRRAKVQAARRAVRRQVRRVDGDISQFQVNHPLEEV